MVSTSAGPAFACPPQPPVDKPQRRRGRLRPPPWQLQMQRGSRRRLQRLGRGRGGRRMPSEALLPPRKACPASGATRPRGVASAQAARSSLRSLWTPIVARLAGKSLGQFTTGSAPLVARGCSTEAAAGRPRPAAPRHPASSAPSPAQRRWARARSSERRVYGRTQTGSGDGVCDGRSFRLESLGSHVSHNPELERMLMVQLRGCGSSSTVY
mmetsp:Transcript_85857/g.246407  ORF Transcript_85857/g.246407 Transcript_85857/m.246407 type:complete len:212 (-) Transcript_85857:53-688(-)